MAGMSCVILMHKEKKIYQSTKENRKFVVYNVCESHDLPVCCVFIRMNKFNLIIISF